MTLRLVALVSILSMTACLGGGPEPELGGDLGEVRSMLSSAERRTRAGQIRDAAAARGITQGWLLAGIADAETGMSHCWSELTWACEGPASADCGGGPVVAGAGDGPCYLREGGLGMFQFDAGTFDDTLRREGDRILSIDGNVAAAIDFVLAMVVRSAYVSGVDTTAQARAWVNGVRVGNERWDPWIRTVTHYYNGCAPSYGCFSSRYAHYRDNTTGVLDEMGADFWGTRPDFAAEFVRQSFPLASEPFLLYPGEERAGSIELRNVGTATWTPALTRLGTTEPRDASSPLQAADWLRANRPAAVDREVAPGDVGRLSFSVRAPTAVGDYSQYFNLVEEGRAWFSDRGGPRDSLLQVRVTVVERPSCPAGLTEDWTCDGDTRIRCVGGVVESERCELACFDGLCTSAASADADGDGSPVEADCDDDDPQRYPGAWDFCDDGIDQDCDGRDRPCSELVDGGGAPTVDAGVDAPPRMDESGLSRPPDESPGADGPSPDRLTGRVCVVAFGMKRRPEGPEALLFAVGIWGLVRRRRRSLKLERLPPGRASELNRSGVGDASRRSR